jgi:RimJ/RimL family protein N-acetyltransferase
MDGLAGLIFRPHTSEDLAFLLDSWANSYYQGSNARKIISPEEFHSYHRPIRERFFQKTNTTCIVCSPDDEPNQILGWIGVEQIPSGLILQYIYVKSAFKGQGLAKQLIKHAIVTQPVLYTHLTDRAAQIMSKKYDHFRGWKMIPHLV